MISPEQYQTGPIFTRFDGLHTPFISFMKFEWCYFWNTQQVTLKLKCCLYFEHYYAMPLNRNSWNFCKYSAKYKNRGAYLRKKSCSQKVGMHFVFVRSKGLLKKIIFFVLFVTNIKCCICDQNKSKSIQNVFMYTEKLLQSDRLIQKIFKMSMTTKSPNVNIGRPLWTLCQWKCNWNIWFNRLRIKWVDSC